jgi:DcuC family C4-dicarboxylate transporter
MTLLLGAVVIVVAIVAVARRVDVRLALALAGLALGALACQTQAVVQMFLLTLCNEQFVVPICCAMGFAYVLRHTGCDQHLVQLLVKPMRKVRILLIPGAVLVGFVVNIPIISQASTVVTIGAVVAPLLRAARLSPVTIGAALLLGASLGGELLNPGAPELRTISDATKAPASDCVGYTAPLLLVHLAVAVGIFWFISARAEVKWRQKEAALLPADGPPDETEEPPFQVNWLKAAVPLLPLAILFLTGPPLSLFPVPRHWLMGPKDLPDASPDSRLIGAAMLIGAGAAALTGGKKVLGAGTAFFDGAGYALTRIISVIVAANCFGEGVKQIGLGDLLGAAIAHVPAALTPAAAGVPLGFAALCGSGMASTQSLFRFFVEPAPQQGVNPAALGAVVCISAAAGRTMSPVAAVTLMSANLSGAEGLALVRRVVVPLLVGVVVVVVLRILWPAG